MAAEDDPCQISTSAAEQKRRLVSVDVEGFRFDMVAAHNRYRSLHGCPPLEHSQELEDSAQAWAETTAARGRLEYCEQLNGVGETVCCAEVESCTAKDIVREWYQEIKRYSFADPKWTPGAFRFSQLLWKSSRRIGVGVAPLPGRPALLVVVRYLPAGNSNRPGDFQRNVPQRVSLGSVGSESSFVRSYSAHLGGMMPDSAFV